MASALDFFGDSAAVTASESAPCLGKRKRQELMEAESESNCKSGLEEGCDVESAEEEEELAMEHGSGGGVAMTLLAGHTPMEPEKAGRRKKRKKLTKETKQLLRRQEV